MKTHSFLLLLTAVMAANSSLAEGAELALGEVIATVLRENPSLHAAEARWQAALERVPQERAWADPEVDFRLEREGTSNFADLSNNAYELAQEIPLSGRNLVRGRIAAAEARQSEAAIRRERNALIALARVAYYQYANARAQLDLNRRNQKILGEVVEATRIKYETGSGSQGESFNAQTSLAELEDDATDNQLAVRLAQTRLNVLMNRDPRAELGVPSALAYRPLEHDYDALRIAALRHRPELQSVEASVDAANHRTDLAKRAWVPDPSLYVEARQFVGEEAGKFNYDTGIKFSVPWVNPGKYRAAQREADKQRTAALKDLEVERLVTSGAIREALEGIETSRHHYMNYRDKILPLAGKAVEANRIAFENGRGIFADLLDAQLTAQRVEAKMLEHLTNYLSAIADLESYVGITDRTPSPAPANRHVSH